MFTNNESCKIACSNIKQHLHKLCFLLLTLRLFRLLRCTLCSQNTHTKKARYFLDISLSKVFGVTCSDKMTKKPTLQA